MATRDDVRQIIAILDEEGFGALAGELLTEVSLGRELYSVPETESVRVPISNDEQVDELMHLLRLRLVEPVRALAKAERLAGALRADGVDQTGSSPVPIAFIDSNNQPDPSSVTDQIGDAADAEKLDDLLRRLPGMIASPSSSL